jgi:phosphatidylglycerophosphate synthase
MREAYYDPERPLKYKYVSENRSILDNHVLNHWWPIAIKAVPPKASANLVSILGSLCCWGGFLVLSGAVFGPTQIVARHRPWIFGLAALLVFLYQTLDSLDGIQARRTGASGPLGEFIDHWFDSINAFLIPFGIALAFPAIPPAVAAVALFLSASAGWLSAKAMRDTGVMRFGPISGEEVLSFTYLFLLAVWATGYDFWTRPGPLGIPLIAIVYAIVPLLLAASSIASALSIRDFGHYAAAMASLVPALAWTILALPAYGSEALALGGLVLCFEGSRFAGDVLRDRLVGLEYRAFQLDILVVDALLLVSILLPGLPRGAAIAVATLVCVWLGASLASQFGRTVARVREVTGIGLWRPVAQEGVPAFNPGSVDGGTRSGSRWRRP